MEASVEESEFLCLRLVFLVILPGGGSGAAGFPFFSFSGFFSFFFLSGDFSACNLGGDASDTDTNVDVVLSLKIRSLIEGLVRDAALSLVSSSFCFLPLPPRVLVVAAAG